MRKRALCMRKRALCMRKRAIYMCVLIHESRKTLTKHTLTPADHRGIQTRTHTHTHKHAHTHTTHTKQPEQPQIPLLKYSRIFCTRAQKTNIFRERALVKKEKRVSKAKRPMKKFFLEKESSKKISAADGGKTRYRNPQICSSTHSSKRVLHWSRSYFCKKALRMWFALEKRPRFLTMTCLNKGTDHVLICMLNTHNAYTHIYVCICTHTNIYKYIYTYVCVCVYIYMFVAYAYIYLLHTYIYIYVWLHRICIAYRILYEHIYYLYLICVYHRYIYIHRIRCVCVCV